MKRIIYLFASCLILASCAKDSFVSDFDQKPEERITESITLVNNMLIGAPNGWIATLPTNAGGAYGFYITFDANQNVTMYADLNSNTSTSLGKSTFRVKTGLGADLVFDTYNYISMLADPNSNVFGGVTGTGHKSDVEFTYVRSTADSIFFIGKAYRQTLSMVKATAAQKTAYTAGELKNSVDKLTAFFANTKYPYIEIGSGANLIKAAVGANFTNNLANGKRLELTALKGDAVSSAKGKFAVELAGMTIASGGLSFEGILFVRTAWKDATTLALYDNANKEYVIKSNPVPLTPLALQFGFPTAFPYKKISIGTGLPAGVTSGFNSVYNQVVTLFGTIKVNAIVITLTGNSTLTVDVTYFSTASFLATATYTYSRTGDVLTLSSPIYSANWNTRAVPLKPLTDYMLSGPFKIDWVTSTNPNAGNLGGLYRTGDLSSFIYGTLQ